MRKVPSHYYYHLSSYIHCKFSCISPGRWKIYAAWVTIMRDENFCSSWKLRERINLGFFDISKEIIKKNFEKYNGFYLNFESTKKIIFLCLVIFNLSTTPIPTLLEIPFFSHPYEFFMSNGQQGKMKNFIYFNRSRLWLQIGLWEKFFKESTSRQKMSKEKGKKSRDMSRTT